MSTTNERLIAIGLFAGSVFLIKIYQNNRTKRTRRTSILRTMNSQLAVVSQSEVASLPCSPSKRVSTKQSDVVALPDEKVQGPRMLKGTSINTIRLHDINTLCDTFPSAGVSNNLSATYNKVMGEEDYILSDIVRKCRLVDSSSEAFVRAGPRSTTHFDPETVRAAIVTCGGLCPGLNNVVRELVHSLFFLYGVHEGRCHVPSLRVVWCGVVWYGVVWCGVVWCGVVWCGVVWCGVVWCGVV